MNYKVLFLFFMMFVASQAVLIGLPERFEEIIDAKQLSFLKSDRAFSQGVVLCQRIYTAGGGGNSVLVRTARYVKTNYLVYYYINLVGAIGVH